jgi:hypothetical protein
MRDAAAVSKPKWNSSFCDCHARAMLSRAGKRQGRSTIDVMTQGKEFIAAQANSRMASHH